MEEMERNRPHSDPSALLHPVHNIAKLLRQGAEEASKRQGNVRATTKVQRMTNSLQWRQVHSSADHYPLPLDSGCTLRLRQVQAGEVTGLGTGATVWPAAHVLVKYLERRYGAGGMHGLRVVDLGSGTGAVGIAAAALGADVCLTDQEQLAFLMRENADTCSRECGIPEGMLRILQYNWGGEDGGLAPPVDVVIVSDCVLPKLYPIEPLVEAIDRLSGPDTVSILSYEHRYFEGYDPRRRFEELATAHGLAKTKIPHEDHHPIFSADDIEIWEVRRRAKEEVAANAEDKTTVEILARESGETKVAIMGELHTLCQDARGPVGGYLWPSGVVMARHLVSGTLALTPRATLLELGAGVGLVAMAAALMGWKVVATDKEEVIPQLRMNVEGCLASTKRGTCGTAQIVKFDWGSDVSKLLEMAGKEGFDVVVCADCVYAQTSVEPLLRTLLQVCHDDTTVLMANERRTSFDKFLSSARGSFLVKDTPLPEGQMAVDSGSNAQPKPIAMKRLQRCLAP